MEEKGIKISLAVIQSFIVVLLGYSLSFVKETDILSTTMIVLYILHYIVFILVISVKIFLKEDIYVSLFA